MLVSKDDAIELLLSGEVIGIPTDTVYGFACLSDFKEKIYILKNRNRNKKLISFISPDYQLSVDEYTQSQFDLYWPGNTTFIIEQDGELVSYRIPNELNVINLLIDLKVPILTTSANLSGEEPIINSKDFELKFPNIPLLKEEICSVKSNVPSEIYIIKNREKIKVR